MMEFFQLYGPSILAGVIAVCGAITGVCATVKTFKIGRRMRQHEDETNTAIQVTQSGIVEAFKTAKISPEWKVDISNLVDKKLQNWADKFLTMFEEHEEIRTRLALVNAKILAFTAAYNKLTPAEKEEVEALLKEITNRDSTIVVDEPTIPSI